MISKDEYLECIKKEGEGGRQRIYGAFRIVGLPDKKKEWCLLNVLLRYTVRAICLTNFRELRAQKDYEIYIPLNGYY